MSTATQQAPPLSEAAFHDELRDLTSPLIWGGSESWLVDRDVDSTPDGGTQIVLMWSRAWSQEEREVAIFGHLDAEQIADHPLDDEAWAAAANAHLSETPAESVANPALVSAIESISAGQGANITIKHEWDSTYFFTGFEVYLTRELIEDAEALAQLALLT